MAGFCGGADEAVYACIKHTQVGLAGSSAIIVGSVAMSGSAYYYYFGHNT